MSTTEERTQSEQPEAKSGPNLKPEGAYKGIILKHSFELSAKKTPYVELMVRFTHYENDALEWEELAKPFTRPVRLYLSENAKDNAKQSLEWLGFKGKTMATLLPTHPEAFVFKDKEIFATCRHGEYQGRGKEEWNMRRRRKPSDLESLLAAAEELDETWNEDEVSAEDFADASF